MRWPSRLARYSVPRSRWRSTKPIPLSQLEARETGRVRRDHARSRTRRRPRSAGARRAAAVRCGPAERFASATARATFAAVGIAARADRRPSTAHRRTRAAARRGSRSSQRAPRQRRAARVRRAAAELRLDAQQAVVLRDAVRARQRAGLDLAAAAADREVGDRRVLGLAGAMRHDRRVARGARDADRLERLGERPDLVHLDQDRVGDALRDALAPGSSGSSRTGRRRRAACARRAAG